MRTILKVERMMKVADLGLGDWVEFTLPDQSFGCETVQIRKFKVAGLTLNKVEVRLIGGAIDEGFEGKPKPFETTFSIGRKAINAIWQESFGADYTHSTEEQDMTLQDLAQLAALKYNLEMTPGYEPTYGNKIAK